MKAVFLGTGEAFDERHPNNSSLVISGKNCLMLDCADASVVQLWRYQVAVRHDFNFLDGVYISHKHSDHFFGLPALVSRMYEEARTKPFAIFCANDIKGDIANIMQYAYQGLETKFGFSLSLVGIEPGETRLLDGLELSFAETKHSKRNVAIKVSDGKKTMCYSGDGTPTEKAIEMYRGSDLLIHEAYLYDTKVEGHGCVVDLIDMAKGNDISKLALTHLKRNYRRDETEMRKLAAVIARVNEQGKLKVLLPRPMYVCNF